MALRGFDAPTHPLASIDQQKSVLTVSPGPYFGHVHIDETKVCSAHGCGGDPVAVMPVRNPEATGVRWMCRDHADAVAAYLPELDYVRELARTCQYDVQGHPCGALATYLAIFDDPARPPRLAVSSLCERHIDEGEEIWEQQ